MERLKRLILLFIFIVLPLKVNAMTTKSDFIDVNDNGNHVDVGEISFKTITYTPYINMDYTSKNGFRLSAVMFNGYDKDIDLNLVFSFYDNNKKLLKDYEEKYTLVSGAYETYEKLEVLDVVDRIRYYSVSLEILTNIAVPSNDEKKLDYCIDNVNNIIEITKDRNIIYNEKLTMFFNKETDSVYRNIPVRHIYKIKDIKVNNKYVIDLDKGVDKIKVINKNAFYKDEDINISYKYDLGNDYNKFSDVVNVYIADNYNVAVKNLSFEIVIPSKDGFKEVKFYNGKKKLKIKYKLDNNKIVGVLDNISSKDSIKASLIFDNGYFKDTKSIYDNNLILCIILPILSLLITNIVVIIGKSKKIVAKKLNISMINKYSSLEIGYLYNDKLDDKDIMSMILSLADKGYLDIEYINGKYRLYKNKEYHGSNSYEKDLFNLLFSESVEVREEELYNKDNKVLKEIKTNINNKYKKKFYNNFINKYALIMLFGLLVVILVNNRIIGSYDSNYLIVANIITSIIYIAVFILANRDFRFIEMILAYLSVFVFYVFLAYFIIIPSLVISKIYIISYILCFVCIIMNFVLYRNIPKRRVRFNNILKHINRLKVDIECNKISDKDFYKILPYTYAIDEYDVYVRKFNNIECPKWYLDTDKDFNKMCIRLKELLENITYDLTHDEY